MNKPTASTKPGLGRLLLRSVSLAVLTIVLLTPFGLVANHFWRETTRAHHGALVYTGIAVVGALAALVLLVFALLGWLAVRRSGRRATTRRTARLLLREAVRKLLTHGAFIVIGIIALHIPPPLRAVSRLASFRIALIIAALNLYLTLDTLWTLWEEYAVRVRLWAWDRAFPPPKGS